MPHRPKLKLLIVEDDDDTLRLLARHLRGRGWDVSQASSGLQAHQHLHSGVAPPDVVLVDLAIPPPTGADIIRLVRQMDLRGRRDGAPVRVVAFTGHDHDDPSIAAAREAGADEVIFKGSVTLDDIVNVLHGPSRFTPDPDSEPKGTP